MSNIRLIVADYVWELYAQETLEERFKVYEKYVGILKFDTAIYTFVPKLALGDELPPNIFLRTSDYPTDFLDHYVSEGLERYDFTVRNMIDGDMSVKDWRVSELKQQITPEEADLLLLAKEDYGLNNGLSIPLMNKSIGGSAVSVTSLEKDAAFNQLKEENLEALIHCTRLFHDASLTDIQQLPLNSLSFLLDLTEKERGLLRHLASGKPLKNVTYSIDVASYGVASNMLNILRERFGKKVTRDQLMYLVGLLDILSFYTD